MIDEAERRKWDRYYRELAASTAIDPAAAVVYDEVADAVDALIAPAARTLEAGCGAGFQSLFFARRGRTVSLLDFSDEALAVARKVFAEQRIAATFEVGDIGESAGPADHELVFNSGVLEHYSFDEQLRLLRGMAARSSDYVLVLVPNRHCHWYWIWRAQQAAAGLWPFGYEKPASDYRPVIEAAGLHYVGRAWFATAAGPFFLKAMSGLSDELRGLITQIHEAPILPVEQRAYLVGFLAATRPATGIEPFVDGATGQRLVKPAGDARAADAADARAADALDELARGFGHSTD